MINSPTDLSACVIWLDGSNSTYLKSLSTGSGDVANGSAVGYWQNLGSLSSVGHFTNLGGSSSTRPTYISSLSSLRFSNAQYLTLSATQVYTAQTVFVAISPFVFADQDRIYSQAASGAADNATYLPLVQTGTTGGVCSYTGAATTARSTVSHRALSTFDTFTSWHSGGGIINFRNGESAASFAHTLGTLTALRHRIGSGITSAGVNTNDYSGDISEVIVYSRALTNAEREDVEYYLSRKWSVLNSIPRQVYALRNGNWDDTNLWSVSADPSPWNVPIVTDNVYTNSFTVTANTSTRVDTIRNSANAPNISAGGSFVLANGVSLSANMDNGAPLFVLTTLPSTTATLVGNLNSITTNTTLISCAQNSNLTIIGNSNSTSGGPCISNQLGSRLTIFGNVFNTGGQRNITNASICTINGTVSGTQAVNAGVIFNNNTSIINIFGNVVSSSHGFRSGTVITSNGGVVNIVGNVNYAPGVSLASGPQQAGIISGDYGETRTVNITGNLGSYAIGSYNINGGVFNITGNLIPEQNIACVSMDTTLGGTPRITVTNGIIQANNLAHAIQSSTTSTVASVVTATNCNIINAPNGRQAIYAPRYQVFPSSSPTYTRHAVNGYNSFVDYWTSDATFSYPASSNVVQNVLYSNNTLSGSMVVPSTSSVFLGVPVQLSTGTLAPMSPSSFWNTSINSLSASNSIGLRLKNITTTESFSAIVKSLVYS